MNRVDICYEYGNYDARAHERAIDLLDLKIHNMVVIRYYRITHNDLFIYSYGPTNLKLFFFFFKRCYNILKYSGQRTAASKIYRAFVASPSK